MNGNWTRATWWYNACLVMQRYFAAVSMSSQRGSMVGLVRVMGWRSSAAKSTGGMTSLGSIGNLSKLSRGVIGEDVVRSAERVAGRRVRTALGISGPCDRRGLKPRHLESARAVSVRLIHGTRRRAAELNVELVRQRPSAPVGAGRGEW